ncbi:hypothetical protein AKO1_001579 [Acrasis kona]|uniref:EGF-like domain-containing protein n=1 Tax=Acrasis kona TaxID=1008807 RepID=A0AAW2ZDC7_9EUKA
MNTKQVHVTLLTLLLCLLLNKSAQSPSCYGVDSTTPYVCSGHGNCSSLNTCSCYSGYFGSQCEAWRCDGLLMNDTNVCPNTVQGNIYGKQGCVSPNVCSNTTIINYSFEYPSTNNTVSTIYGWSSTSSFICANNYAFTSGLSPAPKGSQVGVLQSSTASIQQTVTVYDGATYTLSFYSVGRIPNASQNIYGLDITTLINNVTVITIPAAQNYLSNYTAYTSSPITLSGIKANITFNALSSIGSSSNNSTMIDVVSLDMVTFSCSGFDRTSSSVCSAHGNCVAPNICSCNPGYYGFNCEFTYWSCYGLINYHPSVCSGKGTCASSNICVCNSGYVGDICQVNANSGVIYPYISNFNVDPNQDFRGGQLGVEFSVSQHIVVMQLGLYSACNGFTNDAYASLFNYSTGSIVAQVLFNSANPGIQLINTRNYFLNLSTPITLFAGERYAVTASFADACLGGTIYNEVPYAGASFPNLEQFYGSPYISTLSHLNGGSTTSYPNSRDTWAYTGGTLGFKKMSCYGVAYDSASVCSGRGSCIQLDQCVLVVVNIIFAMG